MPKTVSIINLKVAELAVIIHFYHFIPTVQLVMGELWRRWVTGMEMDVFVNELILMSCLQR